MCVEFPTLESYTEKRHQIEKDSGYQEGRYYCDVNPRVTLFNTYIMPVVTGYEQFFEGMTKLPGDEDMYPPPPPIG